MSDPLEAFSDHYRAGQPIHLALLTASTKAESDAAVRDEHEWTHVLIDEIAPPMGFNVLAVLDFIQHIEPHERKRFDRRGARLGSSINISSTSETIEAVEIGYLSDAHTWATLTMDVRLTRMLNILKSGKRPKAKVGRKEIDDDAIVADVQKRLAKQKRQNKSAALREALDERALTPGQEEFDIAKAYERIYKKI